MARRVGLSGGGGGLTGQLEHCLPRGPGPTAQCVRTGRPPSGLPVSHIRAQALGWESVLISRHPHELRTND